MLLSRVSPGEVSTTITTLVLESMRRICWQQADLGLSLARLVVDDQARFRVAKALARLVVDDQARFRVAKAVAAAP